MKQMLAAAVLISGVATTGSAVATDWKIDDSHSQVNFKVRHMMVSNVRGEFGNLSGTVNLDLDTPEKARMNITVDVSSIDTRNQKRDDHLKSADFFHVKKHPNATFKSTKIKKLDENRFEITGHLTLRGKTKPVTLEAELTDPVKSPWGQTVVGIHATTTINRQDWGISWNKTLDAGGVVVSDEVDLEIDVELQRIDGQPS